MNDLRIVYMGTPEFSVGPLKELVSLYNVVMVVTQPDKLVGRKKEIEFSPVKKYALEKGIEVFQPIKIKEEYQKVLDAKPDLIVTCAYGQIIPKIILDYPKYKCINIHASLLPKYRGGAPIHHSIINGDKETGITIMYMAEGMDSGDILKQEKIEITDEDNTSSMFKKLSILGSDMISKFVPKLINGEINPVKQNEDEVTYAYNISKEDEKLSFEDTSLNIFNKIRGLSDIPGAYSFLDEKRVKIYKSYIGTSNKEGVPGEIINIYSDGIGVKTSDGEIVLTEIQIEGKKREEVKVYLNGIQDKNSLLGKILK